jgi:HEPN domain-containing protein
MSHIDLAGRWLKKAQSDLITARHMYGDVHPRELDISCYHSQQAVEKSLKGYLIYNGIEPPWKHDLAMLCQLCVEKNTAFSERLDDCADLSEYATRTRYPDDFEITEPETVTAINKASDLYNLVLDSIPELGEKYRLAQDGAGCR